MCLRFIGISDALPKSSGIRFVDVWMLFSLFLPFLEVLIQTYINLLQQEATEDDKQNIILNEQMQEKTVCWKEALHINDSKNIR